MAAPVDLSQDIHALKPGMIALRRELHQHPELAFEEEWTAATRAGRMLALGLAVQDGIGGTGVLAVLEGERPGRTLLIRADIDALPMEDTTGREYASKLPNRNHACGHDAHSAVVAGVAEVLARHRDSIAGPIAFVFQPADEPMRGAKRMIEDGLLERVKPDMSLSLPVLPMANAGQVVVQSGPIWASRDELTLKVSGPSASVGDPATFDFPRTAAQVTSALYDLVEHEGKSTEKATFRVRSPQAEQAAQRVIGRANIIKNWRSPFSDDFGLFMAAAPGCLMLLGTANQEKGITEIWHRPGFDIDEDALPVGVEIMSLAALDLLQ